MSRGGGGEFPEPLRPTRRHCTCTPFGTARRDDINVVSPLLEKERQARRDEVAIDLEDRATKKGTPPVPSEVGDIRDLRRTGANSGTGR